MGKHLQQIIEEQRKAEEERSSRQILRKVQRALKEAFLRLPQEEYDWFDIREGKPIKKKDPLFTTGSMLEGAGKENSGVSEAVPEFDSDDVGPKEFYEWEHPQILTRKMTKKEGKLQQYHNVVI